MKKIISFAFGLFVLAYPAAYAAEWGAFVTSSPTEVMESGHLCYYAGADNIACSDRGLGVDAAGDVSVSGVVTFPGVTGVAGISQTVPGDNLGNHTAEQDLDMDENRIINIGDAAFTGVTGVAGISQTVPGDNLGNHTAEQDVDMDGNHLINAGNVLATGAISTTSVVGANYVKFTENITPGCSVDADKGKMYFSESDGKFFLCR